MVCIALMVLQENTQVLTSFGDGVLDDYSGSGKETMDFGIVAGVYTHDVLAWGIYDTFNIVPVGGLSAGFPLGFLSRSFLLSFAVADTSLSFYVSSFFLFFPDWVHFFFAGGGWSPIEGCPKFLSRASISVLVPETQWISVVSQTIDIWLI